MRHITWNFAHSLYEYASEHGMKTATPPKPFPGRNAPTRVAWHVEIGRRVAYTLPNYAYTPDGNHGAPQLWKEKIQISHVDNYVGKPSRYRVLEVLRNLSRGRVMSFWCIEFDRSGVIAFQGKTYAGKPFGSTTQTYIAY